MQGSHNNQKKIAVINDYSGFGRCSIAVAMIFSREVLAEKEKGVEGTIYEHLITAMR